MARNTVVVSITGETKGLRDALDTAGNAFGSLTRVAGIAAVAVAGVATALGVTAVKSASNLEQSMGALQSVFKDQSDAMTAFAKSAAKNLGLAQSDYANLATILGSQLKNLGVPMADLGSKTNQLITLGADLSAQFGGPTSDAVEALSALLRGERDPIERYGVSIKQTTIDAKLAAMGLSGLTGEALTAATTTATLALLYEQTADAQGAFSRESDTLSGAFQRLKASMENTSSTLGSSLLPGVTAVVTGFSALVDAVNNNPVFATIIQGFTTASNSLADFIYGVLDGSKKLSDFKIDFSGFDFSVIVNGFNQFRTALIKQAPTIISGLIDGIVSAVSEVANVAPDIISALIRGITSAVPSLIQGASKIVSAIIAALKTGLPQMVQAAVDLITGLADALADALPDLLVAVAGLIPEIIGQLLMAIPKLLEAAYKLVGGIIEGLIAATPVLMQGISDMMAEVVPQLLLALPDLIQAGFTLFMGILQAFLDALPLIIDAMTGAYPQFIQAITDAIPLLVQAGVQLFGSLVESMTKALPSITGAILDAMPEITDALISLIPDLLEAGLQLFQALADAIPEATPLIERTLVEQGPKFQAAIERCIPLLVTAGGNLIQGLVRGLGQFAGLVGQQLLSIARGAVSNFLSFFGIHSPSRLFKQYGGYIVQGLASGITTSGSLVSRAMDGLSSLVNDGFTGGLGSPSLSLAGGDISGYVGSVAPAQVINVTYQSTLAPTVEDGRKVAEAMRLYSTQGGRQ